MRHRPCILNYHMFPFTMTPSPFRKCQASVSKPGGMSVGGKDTQMASGIPKNLFVAERGPRTLYKQSVGGMSALGMAASHPSVERQVRAPELLSREESKFVSAGRPLVSLLHLHSFPLHLEGVLLPVHSVLAFPPLPHPPVFCSCIFTFPLSHCPCPPCW